MMNTMNQSAYRAKFCRCVLIYGAVILGSAAAGAGQSRIIRPDTQTNSATTASRPRVATLRSSDTPEGSRITVTSDHSLSGYESYRRGDRFYVKVPAANLPRLAGTRGRGFTDVKTQSDGAGTLLSFRLQPGANAHVEQRANKLDLVFTLPGARSSSAAPKPAHEVARANDRTGTRADLTNHARETNQKTTTAREAVKNSPNPATTRPAVAESPGVNSRSAAAATPSPSPAAKPSPLTAL